MDVALTFCRFLGALSLLIGIFAMFAYRRGEMDVPEDAMPPEPHPRDGACRRRRRPASAPATSSASATRGLTPLLRMK